MDLGGGTGHLAIAACERYPGMRGAIFDLPRVMPIAREEVGLSAAKSRIELLEGDYHPDLIVTDMQMPKLSGSELITALKEKPGTRAIPIVILAGKKTSSDGPEETRANYTIYKDIDIEAQLKKALAAALSGAKVAH